MESIEVYQKCLPERWKLENEAIHIWRAFLNNTTVAPERLVPFLSKVELKRAHRFYFQKDRERYIQVHGILRQILSQYSDMPPDQICFRYGSHGKPLLANQPSQDTIHFNLSYSHGIALYVLGYNRRLGIDVEWIRPKIVQEQIAERFFSSGEVMALRSLPVNLQPAAFFACWTRKEALLKAIGVGLSFPLDQVEVSLAPGEPAAVLKTRFDLSEADCWQLQELHPADNFSAAIATEGPMTSIECWNWP